MLDWRYLIRWNYYKALVFKSLWLSITALNIQPTIKWNMSLIFQEENDLLLNLIYLLLDGVKNPQILYKIVVILIKFFLFGLQDIVTLIGNFYLSSSFWCFIYKQGAVYKTNCATNVSVMFYREFHFKHIVWLT